jgi:hypothetical protein
VRWNLIDVSMIVVGLMCPWGFVVSDVSVQARRLGLLAGGLYLSYGLCCASPVNRVFESKLAIFGAALIAFVVLAVAVVDPWWRGPPGAVGPYGLTGPTPGISSPRFIYDSGSGV